uniref:Uncharacterized protein n=1 Tax=Anguilla anguilla TaxID=7936 RepID=A0A0E9RVG7_ANGAN
MSLHNVILKCINAYVNKLASDPGFSVSTDLSNAATLHRTYIGSECSHRASLKLRQQ